MLQATYWTRSRTCAQKCARDFARHKQCSDGPLVCDFVIGLSYFTVLIIHTFDALKLEIKTFIQPFANFIKGAHS